MDVKNSVHVVDPKGLMSRPLEALLGTYGIQVQQHKHIDSYRLSVKSQPANNGCLLLELDPLSDHDMSQLRDLHKDFPELPIVVMADSVQGELGSLVRHAGAIDLIERPLVAAYLFNRMSILLPGIDSLPLTETVVTEMANGEQLTFRMIRPEDAEIEQTFVSELSDKSKYMRFFSGLKKLPDHVLKDFTSPDFPISYAVIAIVDDGQQVKQVGVARWAPTGAEGVAEFAVVVADAYQGQGIASRLMRLLIAAATVGGLKRLEGLILKENKSMLAMVRKMGFTVCPDHDAGPTISLYVKELRSEANP